MPDIAMCRGGTCPLRHRCYRHLAEPGPPVEDQTWLVDPPYRDGACELFWPVDDPDSGTGA